MSASNYLENKVLEHTLGVTSYTMPTTVYVGLFISDPGEDGSGTEVSTSGTGYGRKAITFNTAQNGAIDNDGQIQFDLAQTDWGLITDVAIFDAPTGGEMLYYGQVTLSKNVTAGDTFQIGDQNLTITLD